MPEKSKWYRWVKFAPEVIAEGRQLHVDLRGDESLEANTREIEFENNEEWNLDTDDEFYADYRSERVSSAVITHNGFRLMFRDSGFADPVSRLVVRLPERGQVEQVFEVFERAVPASRIPKPRPNPIVFIGHGHSEDWRSIKEFLQERALYRVTNFEAEPRVADMTPDVLESMADDASVALLVHTAEDELADEKRARQNVVHETGYFQGRLGFGQVIVVREHGTAGFSNIAGVQEIRYPPGQISHVHGEVAAALDDRFPDRIRHRH